MRRVVITRPRAQAGALAELLEARGFEPICFPAIRIVPAADPHPLESALGRLADFDWAVFTSANTVDAVWDQLDRLGRTFPPGLQVAAIGPKTAARLESRGVSPDFVPDEHISEGIVPGLGDLSGRQVILPQADIAEDTLEAAVRAAGGSVEAVTAYHTLPAEPDPAGLAALRTGVHAVVFTSASTAVHFAALIQAAGLDPFNLPGDPRIVCIGPKTAAAAKEAGFRVDRVADAYTLAGLASALEAVTE